MILFMGITAVSIGITVIVLGVHFNKSSKPPPTWLLKLVDNWLQPILHCRRGSQITPTVLQNKNPHKKDNLNNSNREGTGVRATSLLSIDNEMFIEEMKASFEDEKVKNFDPHTKILLQLTNQVHLITSTIEKKELEDDVKKKWMYVAEVLETFFFYLFLLIMFVFTLIILVIFPRTQPDISINLEE